MANRTFIQTSGKADIYIKPVDAEEARKITKYAFGRSIPLTILGFGTNVIIQDGGIRGIVMNLDNLNKVWLKGIKLSPKAEPASSMFPGIANYQAWNLRAAFQGAYGGEISYILETVKIMTMSGEILNLQARDLQFGHRTSVFAKEKYIVLEAIFQLEEDQHERIQEQIERFTYLRQQKQPLKYPS
ncbi:FAD-binding protein [Bacillus sp. T33-2]|uniref:FAD-binding protein n=1 Tax=Bacillus sp. T33-2 TaxID=2054168 RepID=UPI0015E12E9B|nr:FAD-binding protein [Bacillus sp. T33-2]